MRQRIEVAARQPSQHLVLTAVLVLLGLLLLPACSQSEPPVPTSAAVPSRSRSFPQPSTPAPVLPTHTRQAALPTALSPSTRRTPLPTSTSRPAQEAAAHPTSSPAPTPTLLPTSTPRPPAVLHRLTSGGCCPQPFWDPGGDFLYYADRPEPGSPSGWWRIPAAGGEAKYYAPVQGIYSSDMAYLTFPSRGQTVIERASDGEMWVVPAGGREVRFSLDSSLLAWTGGRGSTDMDAAFREVWVSHLDGSQARAAAVVFSGGFAGWFPDGRLLLSGRGSPTDQTSYLWAFSLEDGSLQELARGFRLRSPALSTDGSWLAYQSLFSETSQENGLWIVNTQTLERHRIEPFGAYQWASPERLLVVPIEPGASSHRLLQVSAANGRTIPLTDPITLPFKIANGDWAVSPDGSKAAFVSADDYNIWILDFGE